MLTTLLIRNYVLIKELKLELGPNLNIITGETGAGKSIMLGALALLMGKRADTKTLHDTQTKCIIEGTFELNNSSINNFFKENDLDFEPQCIIRREITPNGKTRGFINDTPVTIDLLRKLTDRLINIHSQFETRNLGRPEYQLNIIDTFAQNHDIKEKYKQVYEQLKTAEKTHARLKESQAKNLREKDFLQFQVDELNAAHFTNNETETLETSFNELSNAEEILNILAQATDTLLHEEHGISTALGMLTKSFEKLKPYGQNYTEIFDRLQTALIDLEDVANECENLKENIEYNPEKLENIQVRLNLLNKLCNKHAVTTSHELIKIKHDLEAKLEALMEEDNSLSLSEVALEKATTDTLKIASELTKSRQKALPELEKKWISLLTDLNIKDAKLQIKLLSLKKPEPEGMDESDIFFSANKGVNPDSIEKVASGGEFSRLMLSIQYILAQGKSTPTLILDEIDTGISGQVAKKASELMSKMSTTNQLIVITHLPQVAACGDKHFQVLKYTKENKTLTTIKELKQVERIEHLAIMMSGANPSKAALESAKSLLKG